MESTSGGKKSKSTEESALDFKLLINDELYDFSSLISVYGLKFVDRFSSAWASEFSLDNVKTCKKRFYSIKRFLHWVPRVVGVLRQADQFVDAMTSGADMPLRHMMELSDAYAARLRNLNCAEVIQSDNPKTRSGQIEALSATLQRMANQNIWPNPGPIRGISQKRIRPSNTKSFGEINSKDNCDIGAGVREEIAAVDALNVERLEALREVLEVDLSKQYLLFQQGQKLLEKPPPISIQEIAEAFGYENTAQVVPVPAWADPKTEKFHSHALPCLLHWIRHVQKGRIKVSGFPWRVQRVIGELGGQNTILAHFEGTREALFAAHTIILIDTGFNVQTCDDLPIDPFVGSAVKGKQKIETITARKRRATGGVVEAVLSFDTFELPSAAKGESVSGIRAIEIWQELSKPIRLRTGSPSIVNRLWIFPEGVNNFGLIRPYTTASFHEWWQRLLDRLKPHPVLGGLAITRKMIRQTVLQISSSKNKLSHLIPQAVAGHSSAATTYRYLSNAWFREQLDEQIRKFQTLWESVFLRDIEEFAEEIGTTEAELVRRRGLAAETGLGFLCSAAFDRTQNSPQSQTCLDVESCATCDLRKFVPTANALEALYLTNKSLASQASSFQAQNPDRWIAVWMPFFALTEALATKLAKSRYQAKWKAAKSVVENKLEMTDLELIRLW